jgi:hypothetical protein
MCNWRLAKQWAKSSYAHDARRRNEVSTHSAPKSTYGFFK